MTFAIRWRLRRWALHGFPTLAVMAVAIALYLAPTKDNNASALGLALGVVSLLAGPGRQIRWRALWLLWSLVLLGAYVLLLDLVFPQADAFQLVLPLGLSAIVLWVSHHLFAGMRMGRRYLWPVFVFAAPAAVHLLYMALDIAVWAMEQQVS